jgi:rod shape-determining protein MreC
MLRKYAALAAENAHLRDLLAARQRVSESTIFAEVLYAGRDLFTRKVVIDKGQQHGIKAGQPVIDQIGIIGQVTRIYPWLSEITLITDKEQAVPVQNLRNGLRAVLGGTGNDGQLELKFIPLNADFQNGDQLVTSGIDGVYPAGLPVAEVSNVERNAAYLFARITCKPLAGVTSHSQVLVLNWDNKAPERPLEEPKTTRAKKSRRSN